MRSYHIIDRDEGHGHGNDKGGSRPYPSREFYGAAWALGEKHKCLTEPLKLFCGLWTVPMWGYYDSYTAAQIELMAMDTPVIVYDWGREKGKKGDISKADPLDVIYAANKWNEKYSGKNTMVKIDLNGFSRQ